MIDPDQLTDVSAIEWVRDQLESSGLFTWVGLGRYPKYRTADDYPAAWVFPMAFSETEDSDPVEITRTLRYGVWLIATGDEPLESLARLDQLSNEVADLLGAGPPASVAGLTRLESGQYDSPSGSTGGGMIGDSGNAQVATLLLILTIAYLIPGRAGRSEEFPDDGLAFLE